MNNKITGGSLYPDIQFGQFRFLDVLYRVIQTKLLQEPVLAQCALLTNKIRKVVFNLSTLLQQSFKTNNFSRVPDSRSSKASSEFNPGVH